MSFVQGKRISRIRALAASIFVGLTLSASSASVASGDARLDPTFGENGVVDLSEDFPDFGSPRSVAEDRRGRLITTSYWDAGDVCGSRMMAMRFLGSGDLDLSFGDGGVFRGKSNCEVGSLVATFPSGGFVLTTENFGGISGYRFRGSRAYRFGANGELSQQWGTKKRPGSEYVAYISAQGIDVDQRTRTVVSGYVWRQRLGSIGTVVRLRPDGKPDKTFTGAGRTRSKSPGTIQIRSSEGVDVEFNDVRTLGSGKILVGGSLGGKAITVKLNNDGSLNKTFGEKGLFRIDLDGQDDCHCTEGRAMVRDYKNRILIAAIAGPGINRPPENTQPVLVRLTADGRLDRSFGKNGIARPDLDEFDVRTMVVQRDGRIVVGGWNGVTRLNSNGSLDRTFFNEGVLDNPDFWGDAYEAIIDHEGRIVITGSGRYGGIRLTRILPS